MKLARLQIAGKEIIALKTDKGVYDISNARDLNGSNIVEFVNSAGSQLDSCLLYTSPSPRDRQKSRMPSSA